jgi:diguanylate cyclase (GGDEF)-like protein
MADIDLGKPVIRPDDKVKPRILIVDDDPNLRKTLSDILRIKGYYPVAVKDGAEAVAAAQQHGFGLALIDLMLPDMPGLEVMARIKTLSRLTEAIILTGHASMHTAIEATNKGAFSYLMKPYQMDDLLLNVRHALDSYTAQEEILRLASHPRLNPNPVIDCALDGRIVYANPAAERLFPDLARHGAQHPLLADVDHAELRQKTETGIVREIEIGDSVYGEQISYVPESSLIRVYAMDITARKRAEREKEEVLAYQAWKNKILEMLAKGAPLSQLLDEIASLTESNDSGAKCSILLLDESGTHLLHGAAPQLPDFYIRAIDGVAIGPEVGSCGTAVYTKRRVIVPDIQQHPYWRGFRDLAASAGLRACWSEPVFASTGKVLGAFAIYYATQRTPDDADIERIHSLANLAGIAIEHKRAEEAIEVLATTDSLTGAFNRRAFGELLESEMARAKRYGIPLSLIMYDLDHFKQVNDTYGHIVGDEVLITVAGIVRKNIRSVDIFARSGGEEFMILSPQADIEGARQLAEKMRNAVADYPFGGAGKVTASFGVTALESEDDSTLFVKRADDALYKAKSSGRNRVECL